VNLRQQLARFELPVEVDSVQQQVETTWKSLQRAEQALRESLASAARELAEATSEVATRAQKVAEIDTQTSTGLLGTLLASTNEDEVERTRARAASSLSGVLAVLEHRLEEAREAVRRCASLSDDARYGVDVLERLRERAIRGGLDAKVVRAVEVAAAEAATLPERLIGLDLPMERPLSEATAAAEHAASVLTGLRAGPRAASVGEALLDRVLPGGGSVGRAVRGRVAEATDWVSDPEREGRDLGAVEAEVAYERASARKRARTEADAKRRAMEELDALDDW